MKEIPISKFEHSDRLGLLMRKGGEAEFAELRKQHDLEQATALNATAELGKIAAEQAKLDARRADIDRKAEDQMRLVYDFNALIKDINRERDALDLGRERCSQLKGEIVGRTDYIHTCWGRPQAHDVYDEGNPNKIAGLYAALEGYSKAVESFPVWEKLQLARISQLETEAAAFSKLHGINSTQ